MLLKPATYNKRLLVNSQNALADRQLAMPVMEAFYTLQGEGFHQGKAAYFIRLAGCDVGCFWCDVKESWDEAVHPVKTIEQIIREAKTGIGELSTVNGQQLTNPIIIITGGEPLLHNLDELTRHLQIENFKTH